MTHSARLLWFAALACLWLSTSSICCGQNRTSQNASATASAVNPVDVENAVSLLCKPADITRSKSGSITGCRVCPEGTDFRNPDSKDTWTFAGAIAGHFRLASEEIL